MKEVPRIVKGNTSPADNGNFVEDSKSKKSCLKPFSLQGRIDKKNFFKGVLVADFVIILLIGAFHDNPLLACLVTALIYGCTVPLRARRLHDRGMSARWLLAFLAPLVSGLLTFLLWRTNGLSVLWGTFLLTEVLQFVTYGCFNGTWESNQFGPDPLWVNACKELNVPLVQAETSLPLGIIMAVMSYFKRRYKCDAIVLPGQPKFEEKWHALAQSILKLTGESPTRGHALALIDCTALGGCEEGALIDKSGIYMVSGDKELDGWLDWESFVEKADIGRAGFGKIRICSSPNVGLHVLGSLSVVKAIKLFGAILDKASGGKTKPSQVKVVSKRDRVKDFVLYSVLSIVCLALLGSGYWGVKCYAHIQNVEKAFMMMCKREKLGLKEIVSIDVPMWNRFGSNKYDCSAKIKTYQSGKIVNITFTARRVSGTEVLLDPVIIKGDLNAAKQKGLGYFSNDDWDVNWGIWGWIGDDYHIFNVEMK